MTAPAWSQVGASEIPPAIIQSPDLEGLVALPTPTNFVVVVPENAVYRIPAGTASELESSPGDRLVTGDRTRTGRASRAALLGPNLAAGLAAESMVEVAGADLILRAGRVYGKTLGPVSSERWVEALGARVRAVGTEYLIELDPATQRIAAYVAAGQLDLPGPAGTPLRVLPGQVGLLDGSGANSVAPAPGRFETRIGWKLHYPAILSLDDLLKVTGGPSLVQQPELKASLSAYRSGDIVGALTTYPPDRLPISNADRLYRATLLLGAGEVAEAEALLEAAGSSSQAVPGAADVRLARALLRMTHAVRLDNLPVTPSPTLATEWLAESYAQQFSGNLKTSRTAAFNAVQLAPSLGPALARRAEMEFLHGSRRVGRESLAEALAATPRNAQAIALQGFIHAADRRAAEARSSFSQAVRLDPRSGEGWLGLGLSLLCEGQVTTALRLMQTAVLQEPQRAEFRTQLAKGYRAAARSPSALAELGMTAGDATARAAEERDRAEELDPRGQFRSRVFPSSCFPLGSRLYAGIAAGPAFVQDLDAGFSPDLKLASPCEPDRPLQFANGLRDTLEFDVGARVDMGMGYRLSRFVSLEAQPSVIWASAPNDVVIAGVAEPGYNYAVNISRGEVDLVQVPLLVGAVARMPLSRRWTAYVGADVGVVFSWLDLGSVTLDCYSDEEFGSKEIAEDSGTDWAFAYQAKAGVEYAVNERLILGLGYQFLGTTEHEWHVHGDRLRTDAVFTHAVSARLDFNF